MRKLSYPLLALTALAACKSTQPANDVAARRPITEVPTAETNGPSRRGAAAAAESRLPVEYPRPAKPTIPTTTSARPSRTPTAGLKTSTRPKPRSG
ncbi:hypothetical protein [Hymenobacter cellulosilyticus]|uniref:Uncharacterized protein n=1 Tax=Hymenobacter cellulosilyticus TaxID=2932248 RepID=A0A8T9Q9K2_9BACT|nr:hypothetical protein [Hymenobacter cellulosilyticus]UOQ73662.1 hypothetical protein MUN79_06975 [Hymenobacter cellulosilyticus]